QHRLAVRPDVHLRRTLRVAAAQERPQPALDLHHRLAARRARVVRQHRAGPLRLALARLDVLALLEVRAADERPPRLAAELLDQGLAALRAHLAGLLAGLHLRLGLVQRLLERPPALVEHLLIL